MQEVLQTQIDFSQNLLQSMQSVVTTYDKLVLNTQTQSDKIIKLVEEIEKTKKRMQNLLNRSNAFSGRINKTISENFVKNIESESNKNEKMFKDNFSQMQRQFMFFQNMMMSNSKDFNVLIQGSKLNKKQIKSLSGIREKFKDFNDGLDDVKDDLDDTTGNLKTFEAIADKANVAKDAIMTGGTSLLIDIPSMLVGLMGTALNALTSFIGAATKFYAFTLTLPFTIAKIASGIGNAIRQDLVEVIQAGGEEAKEIFDLTSNIGESAVKLTNNSKRLLKEIQNPRNRLAQLFGMGAPGLAAFQKESFSLVGNMGHYAESFGPFILSNTKNAQALIEINRALSIGAQETAHYAMEAYNAGENPVDYMKNIALTMKDVAETNDVDLKQIAPAIHKLRLNIVDFGHMTQREIGNLVAKLRKMRVGADDAVSVFKKFSSLEEASKSSAMLFQSFNMNIDAFDLLTARDPGEMLMQFKTAMQQTGKSFESLDRHEKALLNSITGISEQGLSSMMSLMDANMTYEEARSHMDQHSPTEKKSKMIKGLTSAIKQFQKILQFSSPFDAFFQGLSENALNQKRLQGQLLNFNKIYESIYQIAFDLKPSDVEAFTKPVVAILTKIRDIFTSGDFMNLVKLVTKTGADFMSDIALDLYTDKDAKSFSSFRLKVEETFKNLEHNQTTAVSSGLLQSVNNNLSMMGSFLDSDDAPKELKKVFTKNKLGVYTLVQGATVGNVLQSLASAAQNLPSNSEYRAEINDLRNTLEDTYAREVGDLNQQDVIKKANKAVQKRTSVEGRIDRLYDNLTNLFKKGMPLFKVFHETAGRIMGSLITGAMEGTIALIKLFNGGVDQSVLGLGLATEKELKNQYNKNPKDVTILDFLGVKEPDVEQISKGVGKESGRFIKNLPTFMSIVGSFMGDILELFGSFAKGIAGFAGNAIYQVYSKSSNFVKIAMINMGFNPQKAGQSKMSKELKGGELKKGFFEAERSLEKVFTYIDEKTGETRRTTDYLGGYVSLIKDYKNSVSEKSFAKKFLEQTSVKKTMEYLITERKHTGGALNMIGGSILDDQDLYEREKGLLHIIYSSKAMEALMPDSVINMLESSENKIDHVLLKYLTKEGGSGPIKTRYKKILSHFNNNVGTVGMTSGYSDSESNIMDYKLKINNVENISNNIGGSLKKIINKIQSSYANTGMSKDALDKMNEKDIYEKFIKPLNVRNSIKDAYKGKKFYYTASQMEENKNSASADDFYAKQKGMKILIGDKTINLHDEDTIVAFKSGGYFDKMFSMASNNIKSLLSINTEIEAKNQILKNSVQEMSDIKEEEASEDDLIELIHLYDEVTSLIKNREIVVERPKVVFV